MRWAFRRSPHTLPALALALVEKLPGLLGGRVQRALAAGQALREELTELLGADGLMLYPPYPRTVPRHYRALWPPFDFTYTAIFNVMELPVTQVPLGLDAAHHLPLGVQVIARRGNDHLTHRRGAGARAGLRRLGAAAHHALKNAFLRRPPRFLPGPLSHLFFSLPQPDLR